MTLWKLFRSLVKTLRGGASTLQIVLGCVLGMIIGLMPGFNVTAILAVLLLVFLSANLGLAVLAFLVGKALCMVAAPVTYNLGYLAIHRAGLEGLFAVACRTPVLALMKLHYYCVTGGILLGLVLGVAMGVVFAQMIVRARRAVAGAGQRSERFRKVSGHVILRSVMWLLFGKQKKSMKEMLEERQPIFRKSALVVAAVLAGLTVAFEMLFLNAIVRTGAEDTLAWFAGAEANVASADASITRGRLGLSGVQITNPDEPTYNMFQCAEMSSDVSYTDLLAGQMVVDKMVIAGAKGEVARDRPGAVYRKEAPPKPEVTDTAVSQYLERGEKILEYLRKLKDYLDKREAARKRTEDPKAQREYMDRLAKAQGYWNLSARSLLTRRPKFVIRELQIKDIEIGGVTYAVTAKELSDEPEWHDKPMTFRITGPDDFLCEVQLSFGKSRQPHAIAVVAPKLSLARGGGLSEKVPVQFGGGTVDGRLKGTFTAKEMNLAVALKLRNLTGQSRRSFLGLSEANSRNIMKHLKTVDLALALVGPLEAPNVHVDTRHLVDSISQAMLDVGQSTLAEAAKGGLDRLMRSGQVDDAAKALKEGMDTLLGGKKEGGKGGETKKKLNPFDLIPK